MMRLKAVSTVLVEGFIKAWQGGFGEVCGKMWLKAVGLVLVEGFFKARQGGVCVLYGRSLKP